MVASPNLLHVSQTRAALEAGKHVVLEKPVAPSADAFSALISLAEANGRHLIPFQNRRFDSDFRTVQALVHSGRLGRIYEYRGAWPKYRPVLPAQTWKTEADPMNGVLYDLGSHLVDQAIALFGPPFTVRARVLTLRAEGSVNDAFFLELGYDGDLSVTLEVDQLDPFDKPRFHLRGTEGAYQKFGLDQQEARLRQGKWPSEDWGRDPPELDGELRYPGPEGKVECETLPTLPGHYGDFYRGVVTTVTGGAPSPILLDDVRVQLQVLEAARASAETGAIVSLAPQDTHALGGA